MPKTILVVDDSPIARIMAKKCASTVVPECILHEAVNGLDGVEKFREFGPDITLMDLTMPVMSGIEAVAEIRKINSAALVIVATADVQGVTISRAMEAGATAVLQKPLTSEALGAALQQFDEQGQ